MALKVFAIAIVLFLAEIVFLTTKEFKDSAPTRKDIDFTDIVFENIHGHLITAEGVEAKLVASKVLKYSDRSLIYDVKSDFFHQNKENTIEADTATIQKDTLYLKGNVHYENNESLEINSDDLLYNTKTEVVSSKSPFTLTSPQGDVIGNNFVYEQQSGLINADKIRYTSSNATR